MERLANVEGSREIKIEIYIRMRIFFHGEGKANVLFVCLFVLQIAMLSQTKLTR